MENIMSNVLVINNNASTLWSIDHEAEPLASDENYALISNACCID